MDQWLCHTDFYEGATLLYTQNCTKCFSFLKDSPKNWTEAQNFCNKDKVKTVLKGWSHFLTQGELATVPDEATNMFLKSAITEFKYEKTFWIGGMKNESNDANAWSWSDDKTSWNYTNWDPHDLDFSLVDTSKTPIEYYQKDRIGYRVDGKWNSLPSSFDYPFICQWTYQGLFCN